MTLETGSNSGDSCTLLPHYQLSHIFRLVSRADARVNGAIESHIAGSNGKIERWTMVRRADVLEHKIIVRELTESQARLLRDGLSGLEGNLRSKLEHLFVATATR
ncbi:hypothetical protein [Paraburkholderia sp. BCC1886]|uniref:hypothetical protein n=1 Tax=Paraburkholderia sp. BCC1886 TaxID=2562670 RepID=UPI0021B1A88E|nr:hypothetical protein [Paraburkholderia sp. BCC1886]